MPIGSYLFSFLYYITLDDMPIGSYSFGFLYYIALDNIPIESYLVGFLCYIALDDMPIGMIAREKRPQTRSIISICNLEYKAKERRLLLGSRK